MTAPVSTLRVAEATRIQIDFVRKLGRVVPFVVLCAAAVGGIEILQVMLKRQGVPTESSVGLAQMVMGFFALGWGAALWRGEGPANRQYFLSQPVDVSVHELSRVVAGGLWLIIGIVVAALTTIVGSAIRGDLAALPTAVSAWMAIFSGPLLVYFLVATLATVTDRVAEALIGGYVGLIVVMLLLSTTDAGQRVGRAIQLGLSGPYGLFTAIKLPEAGSGAATVPHWLLASGIWYVVGAALLGLALWWRRRRGTV